MSNSRIPKTPSGFSAYINNTNAYLLASSVLIPGMYVPQPYPPPVPPSTPLAPDVAPSVIPTLTNWQRLWLLPTEMLQWTSYCLQFNTLYGKYSDKAESRTTAVKDNLHKSMDDFQNFAQPILDRIEGDVYATIDDLEVCHIKSGFLRDRVPTHHRVKVVDVPVFAMLALGGGDVRFTTRSSHDSKRASKLRGTDIEVRYIIIQQPNQYQPNHVNQLTEQLISSKANFVFPGGEINTGARLFAAVRWIVVNDPSRNGPWTSVQNVVLA